MRIQATAASTLAGYVTALRFEDIPAAVLRRAEDCVIDTVGAAVYGHAAPAGRIIVQYVRNGQGGGRCRILGVAGASVGAEQAALANGLLAHALELDSLRKP